ncbi:hypothetical protein CCACVL1_15696 [Corchorus capsularis]|uniref:TF-B3 domain-containing protein n=1 Tax=Corchorus capsularis TaxID=210143 RepID=A0A1R3I1D2_COCAP|nr:hypothetical protein CCACVL1_15696 [Corchorus capsularis]
MENSYTPFVTPTPTTATTTNSTSVRPPNVVPWLQSGQNSEYPIYEPMNLDNFRFSTLDSASASNSNSNPNSQFLHHHQTPNQSLVPFRHPMEQAAGQSLAYPIYGYPFLMGQNNGIEFGVQGSCYMQPSVERRIPDSYRTKVARIKRKMARQRSLTLQRNSCPGASSHMDTRRLTSYGGDRSVKNNNNDKRDLYKFFTPDNKKLRVLLKKELKNSDVGSLGRIVLPKREAEVNLPTLSDKEGIQVIFKDVYSDQFWSLRYKFWLNNKSRMYVLENTGDFVRQNGLEMGDSLTLYDDESKNLYFSITKVGRIAAEPSDPIQSDNDNSNTNTSNSNSNISNNNNNNNINDMYMPFTCQYKDDEEETSLEILIEQLKQQDNNDLMTLPMEPTEDQARHEARSVDDVQFNFDDCYGGLEMLPGFSHYNFSL